MPTILRQDGFAVRLYPNDHDPPHVHVFKAEGQAKISLGDSDSLPLPIEVLSMSNKDVKKALEIVKEHQMILRQAWEKYHD